ncbi:MAG: M23 family metallopeptidase [Ruminococcus sp.]|nr:M23 family metallopeptidase [Ruminococcus sp.]
MNSPYNGKFRITQKYKGAAHDGLDLVGIDSKEIHATASGQIVYAGWENPANHSQGFGQYVVIKAADGKLYHFGHLSSIRCKVGDIVKITDVIGIEGSTGSSTGSHCHYCVRTTMSPGSHLDINAISGIPNVEGGVYDDGYRPGTAPKPAEKKSIKVTIEIDDHQYSGLISEI